MMMLKISAWYWSGGPPASGGRRVNQISTYLPVAAESDRKMCAPPGRLSALATVREVGV